MWRGNVGKQKNGELVTRHTPYSDRNNTQHTFNSEEDRGRNHNCTTGTERGGPTRVFGIWICHWMQLEECAKPYQTY